MEEKQKITGIILAGGRSCRMGMDKGLCLLNGKPLIRYGLELLQKICGQVLISANGSEYEQFGHPVVKDEVKGIGPMGGLFSALSFSHTDHNLVLSCDMPMLRKELFELLLQESPGYDAVVPVYKGYPEPLSAYYSRSAREVFSRSIQKGMFKMQGALSGMKTKMLDMSRYPSLLSDEMFLNLNTPGDLESLDKMIKTQPDNGRTASR